MRTEAWYSMLFDPSSELCEPRLIRQCPLCDEIIDGDQVDRAVALHVIKEHLVLGPHFDWTPPARDCFNGTWAQCWCGWIQGISRHELQSSVTFFLDHWHGVDGIKQHAVTSAMRSL